MGSAGLEKSGEVAVGACGFAEDGLGKFGWWDDGLGPGDNTYYPS